MASNRQLLPAVPPLVQPIESVLYLTGTWLNAWLAASRPAGRYSLSNSSEVQIRFSGTPYDHKTGLCRAHAEL